MLACLQRLAGGPDVVSSTSLPQLAGTVVGRPYISSLLYCLRVFAVPALWGAPGSDKSYNTIAE